MRVYALAESERMSCLCTVSSCTARSAPSERRTRAPAVRPRSATAIEHELQFTSWSRTRATSNFVIDSLWDRPTHPEGWYFRSDHVPYAERKVPALFFSSNLHSDYHTPRDEPKPIDYGKLTRIAKWMYMTGWIAANAKERPAVDEGFVLR